MRHPRPRTGKTKHDKMLNQGYKWTGKRKVRPARALGEITPSASSTITIPMGKKDYIMTIYCEHQKPRGHCRFCGMTAELEEFKIPQKFVLRKEGGLMGGYLVDASWTIDGGYSVDTSSDKSCAMKFETVNAAESARLFCEDFGSGGFEIYGYRDNAHVMARDIRTDPPELWCIKLGHMYLSDFSIDHVDMQMPMMKFTQDIKDAHKSSKADIQKTLDYAINTMCDCHMSNAPQRKQ